MDQQTRHAGARRMRAWKWVVELGSKVPTAVDSSVGRGDRNSLGMRISRA